jgi:hypothetical protein
MSAGGVRQSEPDLARASTAAMGFVRREAGFAQVTTLDDRGYPVGRTMAAFLEDDWSVVLVQRRLHRRVAQWQRDPRTLVTWVGEPDSASTNECPHVFDLGLLIPRVVMVRGDVSPMPEDQTWERYQQCMHEHRARGNTRAPVRTRGQAAEELVGVHLLPTRVRLEGFGVEAQSFTWSPATQGGPHR